MDICKDCGGRAVDLHHDPPKKMGGSKKWEGEIVPLCRLCHKRRHGRVYRKNGKEVEGL